MGIVKAVGVGFTVIPAAALLGNKAKTNKTVSMKAFIKRRFDKEEPLVFSILQNFSNKTLQKVTYVLSNFDMH